MVDSIYSLGLLSLVDIMLRLFISDCHVKDRTSRYLFLRQPPCREIRARRGSEALYVCVASWGSTMMSTERPSPNILTKHTVKNHR